MRKLLACAILIGCCAGCGLSPAFCLAIKDAAKNASASVASGEALFGKVKAKDPAEEATIQSALVEHLEKDRLVAKGLADAVEASK